MANNKKICIIGGGAAGLAAAASLHEKQNVCILEKNKILGRKIMATGGGRCNLTNESCEQKQATLDFFASLGMYTCKDEEGRYYPFSEYAPDVVKVLTEALGENMQIHTQCTAESVRKTPEGLFEITAIEDKKEHIILCHKLILATGGKAAPQFGTTGDGYRLAKSLGHNVTRLRPILTGIECQSEGGSLQELKGIRAKAKVSLRKDGKPLLNENNEPVFEQGEIQFTKDGLSGICIFNLTPYMIIEEGENPAEGLARYSLQVDLAPGLAREQLAGRKSSFGIVTEALAKRIDRESADLKDWHLKVTSLKGWKEAQCTGGGVPASEVNMETMESKIAKGLYLTGELLNLQGPCGGYNLQNAWETGMKAAKAINEEIE